MKENAFEESFFFCINLFLSHCFSVMYPFLSSKSFQNNWMKSLIATSANFLLKHSYKRKLEKNFFATRVSEPTQTSALVSQMI